MVVGWRGRESSLPQICLKNKLLYGNIYIQLCSSRCFVLFLNGYLKIELKGVSCHLSLRDPELVFFLILG